VKVIRNEPYIEKRSKIGRYVSLAGLAVLLAGMLITLFRPQYMQISFICLLIGFVFSQVGIYYGNRFVRADRPDETLTRALKGLDDRWHLYHYQLPTPHVLLGPDACYVLSVQQQSGQVSAHGNKWKQALGWRRILAWMSQESIGNPAQTAQMEVESLQRYLHKKLPDLQVPLTPVIVFSSPTVELDVSDTPAPVVHVKQLKEWLRGNGKSGKLASNVRSELLKLFENGK
jgi:hypothetical protein